MLSDDQWRRCLKLARILQRSKKWVDLRDHLRDVSERFQLSEQQGAEWTKWYLEVCLHLEWTTDALKYPSIGDAAEGHCVVYYHLEQYESAVALGASIRVIKFTRTLRILARCCFKVGRLDDGKVYLECYARKHKNVSAASLELEWAYFYAFHDVQLTRAKSHYNNARIAYEGEKIHAYDVDAMFQTLKNVM
jgi:hypothetical protein